MNYEQFAAEVVAMAVSAGADEADAIVQTSTEFNAVVRCGEVETLNQSGSKGVGVRVFVDGRLGFASSSDFDTALLSRLIANTIAMASAADPKPENRLPQDPGGTFASDEELGIYDPAVEQLSGESKIAMAKVCEAAAFAADSRITNSNGAQFGAGSVRTVLCNSHGLLASYRSTACSLVCQPQAEDNGKKQVDYDYSYTHRFSLLDAPEEIGRRAALRVLRKLGARKAPTKTAPIVFDRRAAARIWAGIAAALNGDRVYKQMSFLRERLDEKIASAQVTLVDDGTLVGGLGTAPFDGDGTPTRRNLLVEEGVLRSYLYDHETALKAGTATTGSARRSYDSVPSIGPRNLYLAPGTDTPEAIIARITDGFFVTGLMGSGVNPVTGDFSTGASGVWIENGQLAYAVEEVTIAASMDRLLQGIECVANDLMFNSTVVSPTLLVAEMVVSGA